MPRIEPGPCADTSVAALRAPALLGSFGEVLAPYAQAVF